VNLIFAREGRKKCEDFEDEQTNKSCVFESHKATRLVREASSAEGKAVSRALPRIVLRSEIVRIKDNLVSMVEGKRKGKERKLADRGRGTKNCTVITHSEVRFVGKLAGSAASGALEKSQTAVGFDCSEQEHKLISQPTGR
jgi:hypothetical protein